MADGVVENLNWGPSEITAKWAVVYDGQTGAIVAALSEEELARCSLTEDGVSFPPDLAAEIGERIRQVKRGRLD